MVPFYAVDCDAEENKPLCAKEGIKGFPTIKVSSRQPRRSGQEEWRHELSNWICSGIPAWLEIRGERLPG
jgi:protein disulfide-isomerase A6